MMDMLSIRTAQLSGKMQGQKLNEALGYNARFEAAIMIFTYYSSSICDLFVVNE